MTIKLGDKVMDKLTGYEGMVVARTEWLWGCVQVGVQSAGVHEGKPIERQWFDESAVEIVVPPVQVVPDSRSGQATGGPRRETPPSGQRF